MTCIECESELKVRSVPDYRILFRIPFTRWHFALWTWDKNETYCEECEAATRERTERAIYESGYDSAVRDYQDSRAEGAMYS